MTHDLQITLDAADPGAQAVFWAEALGYQVQPPPPPYESWDQALDAFDVPAEHRNDASAVIDPAGRRPRIFFQKVPEAKTAKNRMHFDVRAAPGLAGDDRMAALEAEAGRLEKLGASRRQRLEPRAPLEAGHIVMADPEGNEFCLD
jgi:hypothetical protein